MNSPDRVFDSKDVEKNKAMGIIAYIWILFLVPLLATKDSRFARYHAFQGLALFIAWVIVGSMERYLPVRLTPISELISLGLLVLMVIGIINAAQGRGRPLPLIGTLLEPKE